ncbi:MAG TPA: MASE1 domain-containing protein [Solirubrobacteraceae bacterium]|nr:MASE1 domain-containing protein [Solirubrobacteraceae bacterium]
MSAEGTATAAPPHARLAGVWADERVRLVLGVVALAVLYRGAAEIGFSLQFAGPVAGIMWLPVGVGVAFLYLCGLRYWPGVLIGDLLANDYTALPLGSALGQTAGNLLEVVGITLLLRALVPRGDPLGSVRGLGMMLVAIMAGTIVSATIGSLSLWLGDVVASDDLPRVWRTWWLGDATGALVILPLALTWAKPPPAHWWRRRGVEAALMLVALIALSEIALRTSEPLAYLVFPALIWAALRLGRHGATVAIAVAAGFAVWETTRQVGPFAYENVTYSVLSTQLYIAVAAVSTLCLAAVVTERERTAEWLAASRMRLVEAGDNERRRIEQNLHDGAQQRLTGLVVQLGVFAERVRENPSVAPGLLDDASQEVILAIDELRELAHGIHPSELRDLGLARAVRSVAMRSTLPIHAVDLPDVRLDPVAEAAAYFLVLEALANARKHAHARAVTVRAATRGGILQVEIADDGIGGAHPNPGSGLEGLRDRVEAVGGTLRIDSPVGGGTRVLATIPATPLA